MSSPLTRSGESTDVIRERMGNKRLTFREKEGQKEKERLKEKEKDQTQVSPAPLVKPRPADLDKGASPSQERSMWSSSFEQTRRDDHVITLEAPCPLTSSLVSHQDKRGWKRPFDTTATDQEKEDSNPAKRLRKSPDRSLSLGQSYSPCSFVGSARMSVEELISRIVSPVCSLPSDDVLADERMSVEELISRIVSPGCSLPSDDVLADERMSVEELFSRIVPPGCSLPSDDVLADDCRYRDVALKGVEFFASVNSAVAGYEDELKESNAKIVDLETKLSKHAEELRKAEVATELLESQNKELSADFAAANQIILRRDADLAAEMAYVANLKENLSGHKAKVKKAYADGYMKAAGRYAKRMSDAVKLVKWLQEDGLDTFSDYAQIKGNVELLNLIKDGEVKDIDAEKTKVEGWATDRANVEKNIEDTFASLLGLLRRPW